MATSPLLVSRPRFSIPGAYALGGAVVGAALLYGVLAGFGLVGRHDAPSGSSGDGPGSEEPSVITFDDDKAKAAGLRLGTVEQAPLLDTLTRPGRILAKRDAHLAPMVEGIVRELRVQFGQKVKAGDVLLVIDSKELGQAKLELAKARLSLAVAQAQHDWVQTVNKNTAQLLDAMVKGIAIPEIDRRFTGKPIGEWRQQLVTAYSRRSRSKINLDSIEKLSSQGAASPVALRTAQGEHDTAEASFQSQREEIFFQNQQQLRAASQKLREAQGQLSVAETYLLMVGYPRAEVAALDPLKESAKIGYYLLRAPFDGSVLAFTSTVGERASPQAPVIELADLSRLWVQVDLTESDLPAVRRLQGGKFSFRGPGLDEPREVPVFHVGDVVDRTTRTIALRALADNPDGQLKPGMFIEAQLRHGAPEPVLQVPIAAVQRQAGQTFVFVPKGDNEFAKVEVRVGRSTLDHLEIVDGLTAGQRIVVAGGFALKTELLRATLSGD